MKKQYYVTYRTDDDSPTSTCIAIAQNEMDVRGYFACDTIISITDVDEAPSWMGEGKSYTKVVCPHFDMLKTAAVDVELVAWETNEDARKLLKSITGLDCVPCESSIDRESKTALLHYYESYSGKGRTLTYEMGGEYLRGGRIMLHCSIAENEIWDQPTPSDRFTKWLDESPIGYNAWLVVENAAALTALDGGTKNVWGEARALEAMSGIKCADILEFISDYADANYSHESIIAKYSA